MTTVQWVGSALLLVGLPLGVAGIVIQVREFWLAVERQDPRWENRPRMTSRQRLVVVIGLTLMAAGTVISIGAG